MSERMIKMELLKVDNQGFVEWLRSGNQEMCLIGERHEHAYFRHSLSNGLDILYMYDYMRDDKIPLHRELCLQAVFWQQLFLMKNLTFYLL